MNTHRVAALLTDIYNECRVDGPLDEELLAWSKAARLGRLRSGSPHVYFLIPMHKGLNLLKIGWTSGSTGHRMSTLQTGSPVRLAAVMTFEGAQCLEFAMQKRFSSLRKIGEWFSIEGELANLIGLSAKQISKANFCHE